MIVKPHGAHGLKADEGAEQGADERDEAAEDGNGGGDDVGGAGDGAGAADPGHPVNLGVAREVGCAAEEADEEVLCGELMELLGFSPR